MTDIGYRCSVTNDRHRVPMSNDQNVMKLVSAGMALLFIAWAAFQYNDPDPFLWILVYGLAALVSVLYLIKRLPAALPIVFCTACLIWAIILATRITFEPPLIEIEEWREMMGLIVIATWMGLLSWMLLRATKTNPET